MMALREIGRIRCMLFILNWIERPEERRQATRELSKGEAQNSLKRTILFHRTSRIRDHGPAQARGLTNVLIMSEKSLSGAQTLRWGLCGFGSGWGPNDTLSSA